MVRDPPDVEVEVAARGELGGGDHRAMLGVVGLSRGGAAGRNAAERHEMIVLGLERGRRLDALPAPGPFVPSCAAEARPAEPWSLRECAGFPQVLAAVCPPPAAAKERAVRDQRLTVCEGNRCDVSPLPSSTVT